MATYQELADIAGGQTLLDKFTAAVAVQAEVVRNEAGGTTNHANRLIWAKSVFSDTRAMAIRMTWAVLAQNVGATKAQILAASDATILSAIATAVDVFATGS